MKRKERVTATGFAERSQSRMAYAETGHRHTIDHGVNRMNHSRGKNYGACVMACFIVLSISYAYAQSPGLAPRHKPFPLKSHELLAIQKLVSTPDRYNLHVVRLHGTIDTIQQFPYGTVCSQGIAYLITLKDETGEIQILDKGRCGQNFGTMGSLSTSDLAIGDPVDVLVIVSYVQQPGRDSGELETILNRVERSR